MRYVIERPLENYRYEYVTIDRQMAAAFAGEDALREIENNNTAREMRATVLVERRDEYGNIGRVGIDFSEPEPEPELKLLLSRQEVRDLILACGVFYGQADKWGRLIDKLDRAVKEYDARNGD